MIALICGLVVLMLLSPSSAKNAFEEWNEGDEVEITGHSFNEEFWTNPSIENRTENSTSSFAVSYINYADVQIFLVTFNNVTNDNGDVGTFPYQLFGVHYYTPEGREVFIGAIFAFLMAYQDNNSNHLQDPGNEAVYWVVPFGLAKKDNLWKPETDVMSVQKLGEGHYKMGVSYKNMYAIATPNPFAWYYAPLAGWLTSWFIKFSEFSVTYDIHIDKETGTVQAETFYTIGQVLELKWMGLFPADPQETLTEEWGLSAVHYVTVFTSHYTVVGNRTGYSIDTGMDKILDENLSIQVGNDNERAFDIGYRGHYDLIDETTNTLVESNKSAYNVLLQARFNDLWLVKWQLGFSGGLFSIFSYALSKNIQDRYSSPKQLSQLWWLNLHVSSALWYAVDFPGWKGYRVEHDPVYTAYFGEPVEQDGKKRVPGFGVALGLIAIAVPTVALSLRRK